MREYIFIIHLFLDRLKLTSLLSNSYLFHNFQITIRCFIHWNTFFSFSLVKKESALVLWHINHFRLFNAKSSLHIYIRYIWFGLVGFYGISTIVGYLMPNPLYTHILNIYDFVELCFIAKLFLYMYIVYIWFGLVGYYGISTIVGYLMTNSLYTYILNIYDLVWLGFMAYQPL